MLSLTEVSRVVIDRLVGSEIGRQLVAEAEQELLVQRQQAVDRIAELHAAHETAYPSLNRAADEARIKCEKADAAARAARDQWQLALNAQLNESTLAAHSISLLEAELRRSCFPLIDGFDRELSEAWEAGRNQIQATSRKNILGRTTVHTNAAGVLERSAAIVEARRSLEKLRLEVLPEAEVRLRIDAMRRSIPNLGAAFDTLQAEAA